MPSSPFLKLGVIPWAVITNVLFENKSPSVSYRNIILIILFI